MICENHYENKSVSLFLLFSEENVSINNDILSFTCTVKMCHFKMIPSPPSLGQTFGQEQVTWSQLKNDQK